MASSLVALRLQYKNKIAQKLNWLKTTPEWKQFLAVMGLTNYDFIIPDETYIYDITNLSFKTYVASNPFPELFDIKTNPGDKAALSSRLRFALENGRALLVQNSQTNRIAGFFMMIDMYDLQQINRQNLHQELEGNIKYNVELIDNLYQNVNIEVEDYGKFNWAGKMFVVENEQQIGLMPALSTAYGIVSCELGYEGTYGEATSSKTSRFAKLYGSDVVNAVDWKNFVFSDGKKMSDFLDAFKQKKGKRVFDKLLQQTVVELIYGDTKKIYQQNLYGDNAWKMRLQRNIKLFKMFNEQKLKRSKL
eukprot:493774_1